MSKTKKILIPLAIAALAAATLGPLLFHPSGPGCLTNPTEPDSAPDAGVADSTG